MEKLARLQLGRYGEYYVKMDFARHAFDGYMPELDYRRIDFLIRYNKTFTIFRSNQFKNPTTYFYQITLFVCSAVAPAAPYADGHKTAACIFPRSRHG